MNDEKDVPALHEMCGETRKGEEECQILWKFLAEESGKKNPKNPTMPTNARRKNTSSDSSESSESSLRLPLTQSKLNSPYILSPWLQEAKSRECAQCF
jgi:hypothetical protein